MPVTAYCLLPEGAALAKPTFCEIFPTLGLSEVSCYCYDKLGFKRNYPSLPQF